MRPVQYPSIDSKVSSAFLCHSAFLSSASVTPSPSGRVEVSLFPGLTAVLFLLIHLPATSPLFLWCICYRFLLLELKNNSSLVPFLLLLSQMPTTKTINTISPSQESSNMRAVNMIHGFLPFVASLFYLIPAVVLAICRRPGPIRRKPPRVIIAWPMFFVLVTYVSRQSCG